MIINNSKEGRAFDQATIAAVWSKASIDYNYNPNEYRRDYCGALIRFSDYGNTSSSFGWEIDHIWPKSLGGGDEISNLQALHWLNNRSKGDKVGVNYCVVQH